MDIYAELKRLGSLVRQLQGALGGKSLNTGTGSVAFSAASSANVTVAHGLPGIPSYADAIATNSIAIGFKFVSADATNINFTAFTTGSTSITATITFDWFATT